MNRYRLYVFDLDGTIYRGSEPVPGAKEAVSGLIAQGSLVRYFTNNSAARPVEVAQKLSSMGVACEPEWVFGTGQLAAKHCASSGFERVFLVGEQGLRETLIEAGVHVTEDKPQAVIVGICRSFDYGQLDRAARWVRRGATLIVTNRDATYPIEGGDEQPGAGSIAAAVETASDTFVRALGKPEPALLEAILAATQVGAHETLVIGDRMDTDIECGRRAGCDTWLALTGVSPSVPAGQVGGPDLMALLESSS